VHGGPGRGKEGIKRAARKSFHVPWASARTAGVVETRNMKGLDWVKVTWGVSSGAEGTSEKKGRTPMGTRSHKPPRTTEEENG